jgi:transmembrane 9 superfamily protein 1
MHQEEITEEETGWKMIHGDVFRAPSSVSLLCACVGAGAQILFTVMILLSCVLMGAFKATRRGAILTAFIAIYSLCAVFGGMVSGRLFKQLKGTNWVWNLILTSVVFPGPLFLVFSWVNSVAWAHQSTAALPLTTILVSRFCFHRHSRSRFANVFSIRGNSANQLDFCFRPFPAYRCRRRDWP